MVAQYIAHASVVRAIRVLGETSNFEQGVSETPQPSNMKFRVVGNVDNISECARNDLNQTRDNIQVNYIMRRLFFIYVN